MHSIVAGNDGHLLHFRMAWFHEVFYLTCCMVSLSDHDVVTCIMPTLLLLKLNNANAPVNTMRQADSHTVMRNDLVV